MAYSGNNALAVEPWMLASSHAPALASSQTQLNDTPELPLLRSQAVPGSNVIAFTEIQRQAGRTPTPAPVPPPAPPPPVQASVAIPPSRPVAQQRRKATGKTDQASLDFTPVVAAPPRTLTNGIPASNHCLRPVATVAHRFFAAVVDVSMILVGFGLFTGAVQFMGSVAGVSDILGTGPQLLMTLGLIFLVVTTFYGTVWVLAQRESAGMRVAGLELVTFDSTPLDASTRLIRMASTWLSIGAGGLGVIWAIADEEKLTWQDHISKSFPTFRERDASFVRQNR